MSMRRNDVASTFMRRCFDVNVFAGSLAERTFEPWHEISNNVVCATSKVSDQPAHTRSLIRAFASRLHIL